MSATTITRQLEQYLASAPRFDWASFNCCHFVDEWVRSRTGRSHMGGVPPTPDLRASLRVRHALGGNLADAVTRLYGPAIEPALARAGDIARVDMGDGGEALGICNGSGVIGLLDGGGFFIVDMSRATHAWRVEA